MGRLAVEAARSLGDSTLLPLLLGLQRTSATAERRFRTALDEAIVALVQASSEHSTQ